MKLKKINYLFGLLILMVATEVSAQQATYGGYIYINCMGLPAKARRPAVYTGTGVNHTEKDTTWNSLPYTNMAISPDFIGASGMPSVSTMGWDNANAACKAYAGPDGGEAGLWRLPTQREAMLIWVLYKRLLQMPQWYLHSNTTTTPFWTATESSANTGSSWGVYMQLDGKTATYDKNSSGLFVRCVREFEK